MARDYYTQELTELKHREKIILTSSAEAMQFDENLEFPLNKHIGLPALWLARAT